MATAAVREEEPAAITNAHTGVENVMPEICTVRLSMPIARLMPTSMLPPR